MKKPINKKNFLLTASLTIMLSCIGFALLEFNLVPYCFTLFCVMPILIGFILCQSRTFTTSLFMGVLLGILCFFYMLLIGGFESYFCIITISPLLFALFFLGMFFGKMIKRNKDENNVTNYGMPGRKWLHFDDAIYLFEQLMKKFAMSAGAV